MLSMLLGMLLRVLLWMVGLIVFCALLSVALLVAGFWLLRLLWARLVGAPAPAWQMRRDPRDAFRWAAGRYGPMRAGQGQHSQDGERSAAPSIRTGVLPGADSVTDVQARDPGQRL